MASNKRELDSDEHASETNQVESASSVKKICPDPDQVLKANKLIIQVRGFFAERQGERESMQDRHTIIDDFTKSLKKIPEEMLANNFFFWKLLSKLFNMF